jgi:asparagine synthase (glutamine-hydrolysing)
MCGIWFCLTEKHLTQNQLDEMNYKANKLENRGPDNTKEINLKLGKLHLYMKFFRLSIRDVSHAGDQPFILNLPDRTIYLMCNGEIYNYEYLVDKYNLHDKLHSHSDCEVLIHLYYILGLDKLYNELTEGNNVSGEFAMVIIDESNFDNTVTISACRDPGGVRPLYEAHWFSKNFNEKMLIYSSELKAVPFIEFDDFQLCQQFKPYHYDQHKFNTLTGECIGINKEQSSFKYIKHNDDFIVRPITIYDEEEACHKIRETLTQCVYDRMKSDRPMMFMLSGGLDSSLCAALGAQYNRLHKLPQIKTMCVGMEGGTDEPYAKMVAEHINSNHIHVKCSNDEFLNKMDKTIYVNESFDITTDRASVGQLISAEKIAELTDSKVVIIGDYSDEITGGYKETCLAPTTNDFKERIYELIDEIYMYDAQRADRCIAYNGLESRCPFGDHRFIQLYLSIDPELRKPRLINGRSIEKYLLRKAFDGTNLLPDTVLWRQKEAFSDGVSSMKKSWYQILQEHIQNYYNDEEYEELRMKYQHMQPYTKESLYYREIFTNYYTNKVSNVIPHYWLPKWGQSSDPSARTLQNYVKDE